MTDQQIETKKWQDFEVAASDVAASDVKKILDESGCNFQADISPDDDKCVIVEITPRMIEIVEASVTVEEVSTNLVEVAEKIAESMKNFAEAVTHSMLIFTGPFSDKEWIEAFQNYQITELAKSCDMIYQEFVDYNGLDNARRYARRWSEGLCHPTRQGILTGNGYTSGGAE